MIAVGTSSYAVNSAAVALAGVVQLSVGTSLVTAQAPSAAFPNNVTKGNVLLAMMDWAIASGSVSSVTDSLGNTYSRIGLVQGSGRSQTIWGCVANASGPCTVTFNTDSSRGYFLSFMEVNGYQLLLDSPIVYSNGPATTTPSTGSYPVTRAPDLLIATLRGGNVSTTPTGWSGQYSTNHALQYLAPGATGNYQASWTTTSVQYVTMIFGLVVKAPGGPATSATTSDTYMTLLSRQNKVLGGTGALTSSTEFSLTARNNKLLGGPMASPADTIASMLSKQNKLLGGTGARSNENQYWIYVRTLELLGGTAYPSDNVMSLLNKINKLI